MAAAFNLTAEINLRGPSNLSRVVSDIRRQLSTVSLNLNINPNATRGIQAATGQVQALSAALQTANANAANLAATMRNLGTAISGASGGMNTLAGGLNNVGRQTTNIQRNVGAATSSMEEFGRQSALAVRRFAAFSVATGGIYALVKAISSGYNEFLTFNKELVRLQQVTGATANGLKSITDEITRLSTGFGVTSSELLTVTSTLAQAGLSATQTKTALEALAKSALAPSFDNLNDTVEGSIALMRQFGISAGDLEASLGSINAVAAAFAVESGDIIKAIQRTGGVFASASKGVTEGKDALNEFIALFTSVRATTRESAETIATGLRTIFTRIQRGGTIEALKEYGVILTDLNNKFVGPYEAIRRLSEGLKSLDPRDLRFSQIVEELGGFRQIGKVIPLIQQFATAQQALGVAQRGAGSLADAASTAQLSLANKITKVREQFVALIRDIGQSKSFQTFADISLKLASALISVASAAKEVLPALAALATIRAIPAIGQFVGGFGRGLTRRNMGGPVRAFASGGFVPGSGNSDTIPAMLTPGEFVIRKKAVKAIGANNLHKMNAYANGGIVQKFVRGQEVKKVPIEQKIMQGMKKGNSYQFGLVGLRSGTKGSFKGQEKFEVTRGKEPNIKTYPVTLYKSTLSNISRDKEESTIERNIESGFAGMVKTTANILSATLQSKKNASAQKMQKILKGSALTTVVGTVFETALSALGSPYIEKGEKTKSMDFPLGLGPVASNFNIPSNIPTDATRTIGGSGKGTSQMKNQIKRFIGAVEGNEFTKSFAALREKKRLEKPTTTSIDDRALLSGILSNVPKGKTVADIIGSSSALKLMQKYKINKLQLYAGALKGQGAKGTETIIKKQGGSFSAFIKELQTLMASRNNAGGFIERFAEGGSPEDTVPALLTPGEFVINKKAAKKIGSARLNKLNRADKISGFNKGGSVGGIQSFAAGGGVQRFFIGGAVQQMFNSLTATIGRLIPIFNNLGSTTTNVTRNMAAQQVAMFRQQGLTGTALKSAMINAGYGPGGINNMRTRNQMNQMATQRAATSQGNGVGGMGMGLMFVGPMIAESINSAITSNGGPISKAIGSSITSVISGLAVGSAFGGWGMLAGAVIGAASAVLNWTKTIKESETAQLEATIERKAQSLDKSFEKLSKSIDQLEISKIETTIISNIQSILGAQQTIAANKTEAAKPTTLGRMLRYEIDTTALSKDLSQAASTAGLNIQRYIEFGMSKGGNFDELLDKFGDAGREALAVSRSGTELTLLKALAAEARASGEKQKFGDKSFTAAQLEQKYVQRIAEINEEFKKSANEQQAAQKQLNAVTVAVNTFAVAIKNLESIVSRASAQFEEAERQMDINIGSAFGEEAKIVGPSRLNQNILQNPTAYTVEEISTAIQNMGQNLRFDPEFTKQLETATISKSVIQAGLPQILAEAAAAQKLAGGMGLEGASAETIQNKFEELFSKVPGMDPGDAAKSAEDLFKSINDKLTSNKDISLEELATNDPALNKIMEGYNKTVEAASKAQAEYDQMLSKVVSSMNRYVSALEKASEAQIQASTVRTESTNKLTEALGGSLSLGDLNRSFEDTLLSLTSRIGGNGMIMRGTGTIDPDAIARRLEAERNRLKELESQQRPAAGTPAFDKWNRDLANATLSVRNLTKAQDKLATDSSRASNALSKIQALRQAQESRRGTFDDLLRNLNNPEWMMQFVRQVGSLQRVMGGIGTVLDIGPALDALQQRLAGIADPGEREAERTKFYDNIARILERSGMNRGDIEAAMRIIGNRGPDEEMANLIEQYNRATKDMIRAIENGANLTRESAQDFYTEIMRAANDFVNRIGQAGQNVPQPVPQANQDPFAPLAPPRRRRTEMVSSGGLIYASQGQYVNFEPKGTDTVPAMLTPGEFVVNAKATKKNIGLLKAINSGKSRGYSSGGVVYLAGGGKTDPTESILAANRERIANEDRQKALAKFLAAQKEDPQGYSSDFIYDYLSRENIDRNSDIGQFLTDQAFDAYHRRISAGDTTGMSDQDKEVAAAVSAQRTRNKAKDEALAVKLAEEAKANQQAKKPAPATPTKEDFEAKYKARQLEEQLAQYARDNRYDVADNDAVGAYMRQELAAKRIPDATEVSRLRQERMDANTAAYRAERALRREQKVTAFTSAFGREPTPEELKTFDTKTTEQITDEAEYQRLIRDLDNITSAARSNLSVAQKNLEGTTFYESFGIGLNNLITGGLSPAQVQIDDAKREMASARAIRQNLEEQRDKLSLRERQELYQTTAGAIRTLRKPNDFIEEVRQQYEDSLDTTRDVSIDAAMMALPAGAVLKGAKAGTSLLGVAGRAAVAGGISGMTGGAIRGSDMAAKEKLTGTEAVKKIATQAATEGAAGAAGGALFGAAGTGLGRLGSKAVSALGATKIGGAVTAASKSVYQKVGSMAEAIKSKLPTLPKTAKEWDDLLIKKFAKMDPSEYYAREAKKEAERQAKIAAQNAAVEEWLANSWMGKTADRAINFVESIGSGPSRSAEAVRKAMSGGLDLRGVRPGQSTSLPGIRGAGTPESPFVVPPRAGQVQTPSSTTNPFANMGGNMGRAARGEAMEAAADAASTLGRAKAKAATPKPKAGGGKSVDWSKMFGSVGTGAQKAFGGGASFAKQLFGAGKSAGSQLFGVGQKKYGQFRKMFQDFMAEDAATKATQQAQKAATSNAAKPKPQVKSTPSPQKPTPTPTPPKSATPPVAVMPEGQLLNKDELISQLSSRETDIYKLFGIDPSKPLSVDQIRKALRQYTKSLHPDVNPGINPALQAKLNSMTGFAQDEVAMKGLQRYLKEGYIDKATGTRYSLDTDGILAAYKGDGKFNVASLKANAKSVTRPQVDVKKPASPPTQGNTQVKPQPQAAPKPQVKPTAGTVKVTSEALEKAKKAAEGLRFRGNVSDEAYTPYLKEWDEMMDIGVPNEYRTYGAGSKSNYKSNDITGVSKKLEEVALSSFEARAKAGQTRLTNIGNSRQPNQYGMNAYMGDAAKDTGRASKSFGVVDLKLSKDSTKKMLQVYGDDPGGRKGTILYSIPLEEAEELGIADKLLKKGYSRFARGGIVYASKGKLIPYQPRGTDTVPAMLTPGEFVVNAKSAKKNMGLLKAINGGAKGYSRGGVVYLQDGGEAPGRDGMWDIAEGFDRLWALDFGDELDKGKEEKDYAEQLFEAAAARIQNGFAAVEKVSAVSKNMEDNAYVNEFKPTVDQVLSMTGDKVKLMNDETFNAWRQPLHDNWRKFKESMMIGDAEGDPSRRYLLDSEESNKKDALYAELEKAQRDFDLAASKVTIDKNGFVVSGEDADKENFYRARRILESIQSRIKEFESQQQPKETQSRTQSTGSVSGFSISGAINSIRSLFGLGAAPSEQPKPNIEAQAEAMLANIPNPDYYDELTYKEYIKKLIDMDPPQPPVPPEKERFVTPASYIKTKDPETGKATTSRVTGLDTRQNGERTDPALADAQSAILAKVQELEATRQAILPKLGTTYPTTDPLKTEVDTFLLAANQLIADAKAKGLEQQDGEEYTFDSMLARSLENSIFSPASGNQGPVQNDGAEIEAAMKTATKEKSQDGTVVGYKSADSQYRDAVKWYIAERGKFNYAANNRDKKQAYNQMMADRRNAYQQGKEDRRNAYLSNRVGRQAAQMSRGGVVYASKGTLVPYQPRGTDTVPAMLTPGEFVVNRRATKQNLGLLQDINNNKTVSTKFMSSGGIIRPNYYRFGSSGSVMDDNSSSSAGVSLSLDTSSLDKAFKSFDGSVQSLNSTINNFGGFVTSISSALGGLSDVGKAFNSISGATALLSGTASGFANAITIFNDSIKTLSSSLSNIPSTIDLKVSGSVPITLTVTVNGGDGLDDKLEPFKKEILNEISSKLNSATSGKLKVDFSTSK